MSNSEHLSILLNGVDTWNDWRRANRDVLYPDLSGSPLSGAFLSGANLFGARLIGSDLSKANLERANLCQADLRDSDLTYADLRRAHLTDADLRLDATLAYANLRHAELCRANLTKASLYRADLRDADLTDANLTGATLTHANLGGAILKRTILVEANLSSAILTDCDVFGVSVWQAILTDAKQEGLIITDDTSEGEITVDDIQVAQFIYLLLTNDRIRDVVDTLTSKVVLILGRFTPERKAILEAIKGELRKRNYVAVLFDFEKSISRSFVETVSTLAHMARFVVADLTDAKVVLQELQRIVPDLPSVPVQPLLAYDAASTVALADFAEYPWFLGVQRYSVVDDLIPLIPAQVIAPAEAKAKEIARRRREAETTWAGKNSDGA